MTIPERKSTWPQKDSDKYGAGCQSNKYRKDKIQVAARMPPDDDARAKKYLAAKGQNAYMQLAIKATCAETIQFSLLHELSPFRCDPKPGKTCSTSCGPLNVLPSFLRRARQPLASFCTAGTESEPNSRPKTSCKRSLETAAASSICRASSFAASSVARSGPLNVLPSFLRRARQPLASFSTAMASRNKCKWLIGIVVVMVVTLSSAMSASAASFHVGLRSPKQNYAAPVVSFHVGPKRSEKQEMIRWPHLCMQMTNFTWLTSCSCGWVVCMLEMLSAKTSLTSCNYNCGCSGGNTILCNVCFGRLFPRWAKVTKAEWITLHRSFLSTLG